MSKPYDLIFVALPYATSELHIGRIMGSFLPADVYSRYLKQFRSRTSYLCSGLDCFGSSVYMEALNNNVTPKEWCYRKYRSFFRCLSELNIHPKFSFRTMDRSHRKFVRNYLDRMTESGRISLDLAEMYYCPRCQMYLADRYLEDDRQRPYQKLLEQNINFKSEDLLCAFCKFKPQIRTKENLFLDYDEIPHPKYQNFVNRLSHSEKRKEIGRFVSWGIQGSKSAKDLVSNDLRYYVWIDALLSYVEQHERIKRIKNREPDRVSYFFGKDNYYYHSVILTQLTRGRAICPIEDGVELFERNYVLNDRSKMSSSKTNTITIDDLKCNKDVLRFALMSLDPYTRDTKIDETAISESVRVFYSKYVNLVKRTSSLVKTKTMNGEPMYDPKDYHVFMSSTNFRRALNQIWNYQKEISRFIDSKVKSKVALSLDEQSTLLRNVYSVLNMLRPFVPRSYVAMKKMLFRGRNSRRPSV